MQLQSHPRCKCVSFEIDSYAHGASILPRVHMQAAVTDEMLNYCAALPRVVVSHCQSCFAQNDLSSGVVVQKM
jgi:hypothetical protein